jgi:hypothetical protein
MSTGGRKIDLDTRLGLINYSSQLILSIVLLLLFSERLVRLQEDDRLKDQPVPGRGVPCGPIADKACV